MSESNTTGVDAALKEVEARLGAVLAAVGDADDETALNTLLSAFITRAYKSGKRLGAAAFLQKMGRRMQRCGTPEQLANPPAAGIPLPVLPEKLPAGYTGEDIADVAALCTELSYLLDGWKNHVGLSALLSMYSSVADVTADQYKAGMYLIATGSEMVERSASAGAAAAGMPPATSSTVH